MFLLTGVDLFDPREQLIVILWEEQGYDRHRSWQIRQPAPQSKLRELYPKGLLRLLCADDAEKGFITQNVHPAETSR